MHLYQSIYLVIISLLNKVSFPLLIASSGGSVEGYCAGEKEVLDSFNRWVSVSPFLPLSGYKIINYLYNKKHFIIHLYETKMFIRSQKCVVPVVPGLPLNHCSCAGTTVHVCFSPQCCC